MSNSESTSLPPKHVQVLVIGGGPSGSYAASVLAREGLDVAVFEAAKFPRYHIGESLVSSVRHYLRFADVEEKVANYGFIRKPGAAFKLNQIKKEGYSDFVAVDKDNNAWNVIRSEFDSILLNHSASLGARVCESIRVKSIQWSEDGTGKPVSVNWVHIPSPTPTAYPSTGRCANCSCSKSVATEAKDTKDTKEEKITGTTTFDYLIDASGRAGLISTGHLKNRHFNETLRNIAVWGYWKDVSMYGVGTAREGAPWFESLIDESGWAWFIPLHDGTISVGIVMNQKKYNAQVKSSDPDSTLATRYQANLALAPGLVKLIGDGVLVTKAESGDEGGAPLVRSATDYSYSANCYAGVGYRIVGDAGAFIDPLLSSGIHLGLTSGLSAAVTICASVRGDCTEEEASEWHTKRFSTSYTRFQVAVLSFYKQIFAQGSHVLSNIDKDNFDVAFGFLRPFLQGTSDIGKPLSETELQKSLDFCAEILSPNSAKNLRRYHPAGVKMSELRVGISEELLEKTETADTPALLEEAMQVHGGVAVADAGEDAAQTRCGNCQCNQKRRGACAKAMARNNVEKEEAAPLQNAESAGPAAGPDATAENQARHLLRNTMSSLETEVLNGFTARLAKGQLGMEKVLRGMVV